MKITTIFKNFKGRKLNASLASIFIIFIITFLIFCVCAIDIGYTVNARYKAQKKTETLALYMASFLNSLPIDKRNEESLNKIKENFENLYSNYELSGNYKFEISQIDIKSNIDSVKIKIDTETSIPALFLRYTGIGIIKIAQTSYALSSPIILEENNSDENSFIYKANNIITDKKGDDIEIEYNKSYFVFAGLKQSYGNEENNIIWTDIGSFSDDIDKKPYSIQNTSENYNIWCISKENTKYDFSKNENKSIGLIQYIKIIETDDCTSPNIKTTKTGSTIKPVVKVLNSVKTINKKAFLKEDF